ncbi:MAG: hypothetical protein LBM66_06520 [Bifidobacteriaceae bacterium]|nr:hypothetical protein [Bifidobacteriaceae bacterium]
MNATPGRSGAASDDGGAQSRSMAKSTAAMAAGTFVSRILGFVRAATLLAAVGMTTAAGNAFDAANRIPNFADAIITGGLLNAILVPQIVRAYKAGHGEKFASRLISLGVVALAALTAVMTLTAAFWIWVFTQRWAGPERALATSFAFYCMPEVFFYGLYTLLGQLLNARGSYGPFMWAPVANNVISIAGFGTFIAVCGRDHPLGSWTGGEVALMGGTALLGIAAQALILVIPLRASGFHFTFSLGVRGSGLGSAARVGVWTIATLVVDQVAQAFALKMASWAQSVDPSAPANAVYNNALTTYVIPHSLVTVSLTTVLFTRMSASAATGDTAGVRRDLSFGIRTTSAFTLFATAAMVVLAVPICRVLFFTVSFENVQEVARTLVPLALGLVPLGITLLIKRVFFAFEDGRTVFLFQVPMSALFMVGAFCSTRILPVRWWVVGIGLSASLSYVAGVVLRLQSLRFQLGGVDGRRLVGLHVKAGFSALVTAEVGWLVLSAIPRYGESVPRAVVALVVGGLAMVLVYAALLKLLGVHELAFFTDPLRAWVRRRGANAA